MTALLILYIKTKNPIESSLYSSLVLIVGIISFNKKKIDKQNTK